MIHIGTDHLSDPQLVYAPASGKIAHYIVDESVQAAFDPMGRISQNALKRPHALFRTRPQLSGLCCRRGRSQGFGWDQIYLNYDHFRLPHQHPHAPIGNLPGDGTTQGDHITKFSDFTPATICHECMHSQELNHKLFGPGGHLSISLKYSS